MSQVRIASNPAAASGRSSRPLVLLAVAAAIVFASWQAGSSMQPTQDDARVEQAAATERAYDAARAERYEAAYLEAYEQAAATGATDGEREGRLAGEAAARAELAPDVTPAD